MVFDKDDYINAVDQDIVGLRYSLSHYRTALIAGLVALSPVFWGIVSTLREHEELKVDDVTLVAPYFVSVILFGSAMVALMNVYLGRYLEFISEEFERDEPDSGLKPDALARIVVCSIGSLSALVAIVFTSGQSIVESAVIVAMFGSALVLFVLDVFTELKPRKMWHALVEYNVWIHPESWSKQSFIGFLVYFSLGIAALYYSWCHSPHLDFFSLSVMVFVAMGLVRYSFARYGDVINTSFALDATTSFRRWIVIEDPEVEKIADTYRKLIGVKMKKVKRKKSKKSSNQEQSVQ
jgi:hypothetical protein